MPIRHGGSRTRSPASLPRDTVRRTVTTPSASTPCKDKVLLPSRFPARKLRSWGFPFLKDRIRNSILTPRCLLGTGKSLTFVRSHGVRAAATLRSALAVLLLDAAASVADAQHPASGAEVARKASVTGSSPIVVPMRLRRHFPIIVAKIDGLDVP